MFRKLPIFSRFSCKFSNAHSDFFPPSFLQFFAFCFPNKIIKILTSPRFALQFSVFFPPPPSPPCWKNPLLGYFSLFSCKFSNASLFFGRRVFRVFDPEFCSEKCSESYLNFSKTFRVLFLGRRRPQNIYQKSRRISMPNPQAKFRKSLGRTPTGSYSRKACFRAF